MSGKTLIVTSSHQAIKATCSACAPQAQLRCDLDILLPSSANSAARQALVLFFFCLLEIVMKIQLTINPEQLEMLAQGLTFVSLNDYLLDKFNPAWKELHTIVRLANDEVNDGMIRQASYKIVR